MAPWVSEMISEPRYRALQDCGVVALGQRGPWKSSAYCPSASQVVSQILAHHSHITERFLSDEILADGLVEEVLQSPSVLTISCVR